MSSELINHSPDLLRLREKGYEVVIQSGHLVLCHIPYVNAHKQVKYDGKLVSALNLNGDVTIKPSTHVAYFIGEHPCHKDGNKMEAISNHSGSLQLASDLVANHKFSCKPHENGEYKDYFYKMDTYITMISAPAEAIDPKATARTYRVLPDNDEPDPVFNYVETASTRAEIAAITDKLALSKVGIIGLGGSGSYVLDLISKTPILEIHLFDGDNFYQHNAFRSPGAPDLQALEARSKKVHYFRNLYAPMRKGIISHPVRLDKDNLDLLDDMNFVFLCIDDNEEKLPIIEKLEADGRQFIDVGMDIYRNNDNKLGGAVRVTTSTLKKRDHVRQHIPHEGNGENGNHLYRENIQIADMNMLNAALAVIKWKKLFGFYLDLEREYHSQYTIDGNILSNSEYEKGSIIKFKFVDLVPTDLEEGTLYISMDLAAAKHKCCCGCGEEVFTPLNPTDWKLTFDGVSVSLWPSIGNWSLPCQSHYYIKRNRIKWAPKWTPDQIIAGRKADRRAKQAYYGHNKRQAKPARIQRILSRIRHWLS